jgi:periplasmic protein TonB
MYAWSPNLWMREERRENKAMVTHPDILDQHESLRKPFLSSITFHVLIFASAVGISFMPTTTSERLGDPKSLGGGAVAITPVSKIPLPSREGRQNPVANDTHSVIPSKPEKIEKVKQIEPDPDAIALKSKKQQKRLQDRAAAQQKYTPLKDPKPNQVYNQSAPAAVSPMFSRAAGGGGVGSSSNSPFGNRFGYYEQLLRDAVTRNWHTEQFDARMQTLPAVVVSFEVFRDGTVKNVKVTQSSGNFTLDQSAQRAILASVPLPRLPQGYEHDSANLEFWFRLQK